MPQLVIEMTTDQAQLLRGLQRAEAEIDRLSAATRRQGQAAQSAGAANQNAFGSKMLRDVTAMATGMLSITAAINTAKQAYDAYAKGMESGSNAQHTFAQAARSMLTVTDSTTVRQLTDMMAKRGLQPSQGMPTMQTLYSMENLETVRMRAAEEAMDLMWLGADSKAATRVMGWVDKDTSPEQAAGMALEAARASKVDLATLADQAGNVTQFGDVRYGLAMLSGMSKSTMFKEGQMGEAQKRIAATLGDQGNFGRGMMKAAGGEDVWSGMSSEERVEFIAKTMGDKTSTEDFQKRGLGSFEQAQAMSELMKYLPSIRSVDEALATPLASKDYTDEWIEQVLQDPLQREAYEADIAQSKLEEAMVYGPSGEEAMRRAEERRARARAAMARGSTVGIEPNGEMGVMGEVKSRIAETRNSTFGGRPASPSDYSAADYQVDDKGNKGAVLRQIERETQENIEAARWATIQKERDEALAANARRHGRIVPQQPSVDLG